MANSPLYSHAYIFGKKQYSYENYPTIIGICECYNYAEICMLVPIQDKNQEYYNYKTTTTNTTRVLQRK